MHVQLLFYQEFGYAIMMTGQVILKLRKLLFFLYILETFYGLYHPKKCNASELSYAKLLYLGKSITLTIKLFNGFNGRIRRVSIKERQLTKFKNLKLGIRLFLCVSFFFILICLSGDVETNPGPNIKSVESNPGPNYIMNTTNCLKTHPKKLNILRTLYLNARSLKAVMESPDNTSKRISKLTIFQNLIYSEQYDIVCVCETWLNDYILDNEILPGYTIHRKDRKNNMRGGGVLVATRSELRSTRRSYLEGPQSEHLMIELYPENCSKFILGVFYRPPNSEPEILVELRDSLDRLEESCQFILVGDFNLPNIDWLSNFPSQTSNGGFNEEHFCEIITDNFLYQKAEGPTHLGGNKLDCVFCNRPELVAKTCCTDPTGLFPTDHYLIEFDIKLRFQRAKAVKRTVYDFKNANFNGLREHLLHVPFDYAISDHSDIDDCWKAWKDLFLTATDKYVPKKIITDINTPPWIDQLNT